MPPETIQLGLFVIEEAIKEEPAIAAAIRDMFSKGDPIPDDWKALRAKVAAKKYSDYVPATILPAATPAAAPALAVVDAPVTAPAARASSGFAAVWTGQATDPHA